MNYFTLLNTKWKIYEKEPSITPPKLAPRFYKILSSASAPENAVDILKKSSAPSIETYLAESMFQLFTPSCVIINRHDDMIYTKGEIPYLEFSEGFTSLNIFKNLHPDLRLELHYTLEQSRKKDVDVRSKFIEIQENSEKTVFVRIIATPFSYQNSDALSLLYFQEYHIDEIIFNAQRSNFPKESDLVNSLQTQVSQMKEQLHALQNELDNSNENMQMMNEELQSSNEELQSSNEELETSNEELQATNEELNETYHHINALKQQYSNILESSLDGILGLDLDEKHTFCNSQALEMLGFTSEELMGKIGHTLWHHTKADGTVFDRSECPILHVTKTGEPIRGEDLYWRKDGSSFEVQYTSAPIRENSKVTGVVLFFHDISKEKALERKIKHEQSLIKHYFDTTEALVVVINTKGNIELLNRKGATLLETDSQMMVGKNWFEHFVDKSIQKEVLAVFEAVIASNVGTILPYTNEIMTTKGEKKLLYWTNTPLFDDNNKSIGIIATGIDITQENELKRKLHEKEEMMIAQSRQAAMGDMIAMIAHQWRQPISIISMEANSLQADLELGNEINKVNLQKLVKSISYQTQHLSKTIDDFRNFFKPNKEVQTMSIDEIVKNIKMLLLKSLENNNIAFELDMKENYEIISYKNELIQVLVNLILNAKDAIKEANSTNGKIIIRVTKDGEKLLIEVCDNGIGIPKELLNTLGEPYVSSKGKNGTGLGLYMSKVIVSKHLRGTLEWKNRDKGACFSIKIPLKVSKS
ncbi:PAS domain S-box protein [Sulfurimonas sp. SAG-AH-194-L11]|nr:PAS domain S-box protein [Sulfurimonas sp. SAG-AH-194-L11]MDF1877619.1 PAS domain S-box protein [Sulfurimonas sp. SAG-AH-194-L11]